MEFNVEDLKGILTKMKIEFTAGITQDRAEAKLGRAITERNVPIPWQELSKKEIEVMGEMGFEPEAGVVLTPKEDKKPEPTPAPKPTPAAPAPKKEADVAQTVQAALAAGAVVPEEKPKATPPAPKPAAPAATSTKPSRKKGEGALNELKALFNESGKSHFRKDLVEKHKEWGVIDWTVMNYIAIAKKDQTLLGFLLKEEKDKEGRRVVSRV